MSKFLEKLTRSNKNLRKDRAAIIEKGVKRALARKIEDYGDKIDLLNLQLDGLSDVNPSNTQTIINPNEFNADDFVKQAEDLIVTRRNTTVLRDELQAFYNELFT